MAELHPVAVYHFTFRNIFCTTEENSILHFVQMSRIFKDSKTFVDMKLNYSPQEVERKFCNMILKDSNPSKDLIKTFVEENFTLENQMEEYLPKDWITNPKLLSKIVDSNYQCRI